jgi:hypothetical protein
VVVPYITLYLPAPISSRAARFAAGGPIPRELLLATLGIPRDQDKAVAIDALARLLDLGLIDMTGAEGDFIRMHLLIVTFVRQIDTDPQAQAAVGQTLLTAIRRLNAADPQMKLLALQPHLRAAINAGVELGSVPQYP